jgi:KDO2-lipid IV(A) lauroyltransferase
VKDAPVRHRLEQAGYLVVEGLLRLLPHGAARGLGRRLGDLAWLAAGSRRGVTRANLALVFPELPEAEREKLARESFRHLGAALCDTLSAMRFDLVALCRRLAYEGWEHLAEARARGRGFFVLSAHLGHWEIAAHVAGAYFGPLSVVGRPLDNPHLDRELTAFRGRFGNRTLAKRGAVRGMLRALEEGGIVGILIDQRVRESEGIRAPFFGRPSLASPVLARLSLRTGTPVVPIFAFGEPRGRYRFVARPAIEPAGDPKDEAAVLAMTRGYLEATEREIRSRPAEWMWMHRRWKEEGA